MNLAYVSPLPPLRSGVADYSAALLPYLRPYFSHIVAVVDGYGPQLPSGLVDQVYDVSDDPVWWLKEQVVPLYHMGNHLQYHRYVYRALQRFPGITVLHDGNLLPFVHDLTLARGEQDGFIREAGFERGGEGIIAAWNSLRCAEPLGIDEYPMLARVARASLGVIVHSQYLYDLGMKVYPDARMAVIPLLHSMPPGPGSVPRRDPKALLGLDPDSLLIGAFGFIAPLKRLDQALRAFARLRDAFPQARSVCVGEVASGYNFQALLDELALGGAVQVTGYVPMETFLCYLRAVDVGVNLRYPTWGESSATLVRLMACGVPTVVTAAGAFAELPDEVVIKVPAGPGEVDAIETALRRLLSDAGRRAEIGASARAFAADRCAPQKVAHQYAAFIRAIV